MNYFAFLLLGAGIISSICMSLYMRGTYDLQALSWSVVLSALSIFSLCRNSRNKTGRRRFGNSKPHFCIPEVLHCLFPIPELFLSIPCFRSPARHTRTLSQQAPFEGLRFLKTIRGCQAALQVQKSSLPWKLFRQIYQPYIFIGNMGEYFYD